MKRALLCLMAFLLVSATLVGCEDSTKKREEEERMKRELELQEAYYNHRFFSGLLYSPDELIPKKYTPINIETPNPDGMCNFVYKILYIYRMDTGSNLTYEQVLDYLSKEYEDDGELRIYINGRHPEIAGYIQWWLDNEEIIREVYLREVGGIQFQYASDNDEYIYQVDYNLPTEMLDEILKKYSNPEYKMNLLKIQKRWLKEGKARIVDDGSGRRKVEYLPQY